MARAFKGIKARSEETIAHAKGEEAGAGVRVYRPHPVDVSAPRQQLGLTQRQFAAHFGFSVAALRHWERGDCAAAGPALVLLNVIARDHESVMRAWPITSRELRAA